MTYENTKTALAAFGLFHIIGIAIMSALSLWGVDGYDVCVLNFCIK